jgi:tetratricopeptide (TPR) repeat protein
MKKLYPVFALILFLASCASVSTKQPDAPPSLDQAIQTIGSEIENTLEQGKRVAVVNFNSSSPEFSNYIIEELIGRLAKNRKLLIVDRNNLNLLFDELAFNASGNVSDETAAGIGKMFGAQTIISGSMFDTGNAWRLRFIAIEVETSIREASSSADVGKDEHFDRLLTGIAGGTIKARENAYIDEADMSFTNAYTAYLMGNYNKAIMGFTEAIGLNPAFAYAYLYRGIAYTEKGDFKQAIANIDKSIELYPKFAKSYLYRGKIQRANGKEEQAIADFTQAIKLTPNDAELYYERGGSYGGLGKYELEIADYTQAIGIKPDYAEVYYMRGTAYQLLGKLDLAIADETKAIALKPDYIEAYQFRSLIYMLMEKYYQAIQDCERILKYDPNNAQAKQVMEMVRARMLSS